MWNRLCKIRIFQCRTRRITKICLAAISKYLVLGFSVNGNLENFVVSSDTTSTSDKLFSRKRRVIEILLNENICSFHALYVSVTHFRALFSRCGYLCLTAGNELHKYPRKNISLDVALLVSEEHAFHFSELVLY